MINSDGGSTDGTPELIRDASFTEADMVQTSHSLRTLHRVVAPYHGLPGKHTALRTVFAAAELTQAKVLVVLDPAGPATSPERVTELIAPIARADVEFLAPRYRRHPRDGVLITQLVRPLVRAVYGVGLDEPLGAEFACSGRFASHCLEQDIWDHEVGEVRDRSVAADRSRRRPVRRRPDLAAGDHGRRRAAPRCARPCSRSCCRWSRAFARTSRSGVRPTASPSCARGAPIRTMPPDAPPWDYEALAEQARHDIAEIKPLLEDVLDAGPVRRASWTTSSAPTAPLDDELWVRIVYAFAAATQHGTRRASSTWPTCSCRSTCGAPRRSWRETAHEADRRRAGAARCAV